ncbi:glycoside-pentoside-hexuronide (GPH):cation symporter [Salinisphaera sp. G21_0]|uniref:MFS transporter n=1 Tax=Salinisphaera sp. G21_0 TaxID=2821094 RepID=UPI001AD9C3DD|nr:glycoside-pentoside-hexuronide (GPH):cation symporter [Salinisphaera sp. G21_0]MBO9483413.1 MFS transporter [Salinisphaera sp. G21_0]
MRQAKKIYRTKTIKKGDTMKTITKLNRVGYAMGDLGNTLTFGMMSTFLLAYYTDVLGITAAAAGTLFLVARIWDAVNDPIMGAICDKLFTRKHTGDKFRGFLVKGSWPVAVAAIFVFWAPQGLSDSQKLIWAYATYIVWGMTYTFINIPYGSLATVMTNDKGERASLSAARGVGSMAGNVVGNIVVPLFLSIFADDFAKGYLYSAVFVSTFAMIAYLISYRHTAEYIRHEPSTENINIFQGITSLRKNSLFLCVSISSAFMLAAFMAQSAITYYYLTENLDGQLWFISLSSAVSVLAILIISSFIGKLALKFGTRKIMITGFLLAGITATVCFLLPDSIYVMFLWLFVGIPLMLLPNLLIWANVSDSIDYNSYLSGQRQEGVIYSSYSFARKMGQALAGFIAGTGLSFIGYQAELETQPASVLLGIDALMFLLPAVALFICALIYFVMWDESKIKSASESDADLSGQPA